MQFSWGVHVKSARLHMEWWYNSYGLVIRTPPWRWQEYRSKHVDENIAHKVHHRILTCILLVTYIFFNKIMICLSHSEMSEHSLPIVQHALSTWCSQKTTSECDHEPCDSSSYIHNLFLYGSIHPSDSLSTLEHGEFSFETYKSGNSWDGSTMYYGIKQNPV